MDPRVELLTKREVELLHHVFLGRRTAEIAQLEGIANQTVLNRLQEARGKLGGVDRRTAALIVAETKGWAPGIKATPAKTTLPVSLPIPPSGPAGHEDGRAAEGGARQQEIGVFVETLPFEPAAPTPPRRNGHDTLTRVSMLLTRTALLVAVAVALLWVYGRV